MTEKFLPKPAPLPIRPSVADDRISGKPFYSVTDAKAEATLEIDPTPAETAFWAVDRDTKETNEGQEDRSPTRSRTDGKGITLERPYAVEVPVGISRLHMTSLPALQMKPLYWSPVNDIAIVTRATWFYR